MRESSWRSGHVDKRMSSWIYIACYVLCSWQNSRLSLKRSGLAKLHSTRSLAMNTETHKIALITGGSRGLGRNTAENLARKGVDSVITFHSRSDEAQAVVAAIESQGRKAVALQLDTGATKTFDDFAKKLKKTLQDTWGRDRFDFLINNAGISHHNSIEETTEAEM